MAKPRRRISWRGAVPALALVFVSAAWVTGENAFAKEEEQEPEEEEIDYVTLAAKLFKDGHYDRAQNVLAEADPKKPNFDLPRYYTLQGLVSLELKQFKEARKSLQEAIAAGEQDPGVFLNLARAHFGLKDYRGVIGALSKAGEAGREVSGTFLMRSQSHWELKEYDQAIAALDEGQKAFPKESEFARIKLFYLIDLGLFQEVVRVGEQYLSRAEATAEDYAAVGEGLRQSKQFEKAQNVLEAAHLRFPSDEKILVLLAHTYLDQEHPLIAAMVFEEAARLYPKYALEAAELYVQADRLERALSLNARVLDQSAKMKQRLNILLKLERHEMIAAMAPRLSRLGLLNDENVRYALAYGYFKTGEFQQAESQLRQISDPKLFESALQLRRAMDQCRQAGWECS